MFNKTPATTTYEFDTALGGFLKGAQAKIDAYYGANFPNILKPTLEVKIGQKNAKIVNVVNNQVESVYCFIDIATGNVLKAAGFKAPAKGKRSNIYDSDNGASGIDAHGAKYLDTKGKLQGKIYV